MNDIRIKGLRARAVNVPLEYPVKTAVGTVATSPLVLIDLYTDNNVAGQAYVFTYTPLALKPVQLMLEELSTVIEGEPLAPFHIDQLFQSKFRLIGNTGIVKIAAAGIDMAIWDARAKAVSLPLVELLGGVAKPLPAYDSHSMDGAELAMERAKRAAEQGYTAIKTKIGYATLAEDVKVVQSIRKTVGDSIQIMVDYNQSQTVPEAIRRGAYLNKKEWPGLKSPQSSMTTRAMRACATS